MKCIYNETGACTNTLCPARGDFCPVPDTDGICQYEDRDDVTYTLTPKGCLLLAMLQSGVCIDDDTFDNIWNEFEQTMTKLGYIREVE